MEKKVEINDINVVTKIEEMRKYMSEKKLNISVDELIQACINLATLHSEGVWGVYIEAMYIHNNKK